MSSSNSSGGIGFFGLLAIVFIVLKLTGVIAWSWWWVLSPLWISFGLGIVALAIFGIFMLGAHLIDNGQAKRRRKQRDARLAASRYSRPIRTK